MPTTTASPLVAPTPEDAMRRFLDTEDFSLLEKPLIFPRDLARFKKLQCCQAALANAATFCMAAPCVPVGLCCPWTYADQFTLRLDKDSVQFSTAANDCCCHIAKTLKTVPLEKIQDVELQTNCLLSCFGLKAVNVQTAGMGGTPSPEVSAVFLQAPEQVREALQLAVKLYRQRALAPGGGGGGAAGGYASPGGLRPATTAWAAPGTASLAGSRPAGAGLRERLQALDGLVARGVLSRGEADELKVAVLAAAEEAWLTRLAEAADLRDQALLSDKEFEQLKASLIAQLRASAAA